MAHFGMDLIAGVTWILTATAGFLIPLRQSVTYKLCALMPGVAFGYASTYLLDSVVPVSMLP